MIYADINCMIINKNHSLFIKDFNQQAAVMRKFGIKKCIAVSHTSVYSDPIKGNIELNKLSKESEEIIPCYVVSPIYKFHFGWNALLEELKYEDIKFVKIYPRTNGYNLNLRLVREMMEVFAALKVNVLIDHNQIVFGSSLEFLEDKSFVDLCKSYPDCNFILTNVIERRKFIFYDYLEECQNLYIDISSLSNWNILEDLNERFGLQRVLFGSGMPYRMPGPSITLLSYSNISEKEKEMIAFGNTFGLMGETDNGY